MNTKKVVRSFADALLSADSQNEISLKQKKIKYKSSNSSLAKSISSNSKKSNQQFKESSSSKEIKSNKSKDYSKNKHSSSHGHSSHSAINNKKAHQETIHLIKNINDSSSKKKSSSSKATTSQSGNIPWHRDDHSLPDTSTDTDDDIDCHVADTSKVVSSPVIIEKTKFISNRQAGSAQTDKLVAKMLAEEEQRQQNTRMLQSVDEDLMLFDLQLEDNLEMELECKAEEKVPILPPGLPFLHSLTCHKLYTLGLLANMFDPTLADDARNSLSPSEPCHYKQSPSIDKVIWPFSPSLTGSKTSLSGSSSNPTAVMSWLGSLDDAALRQVIQNRVLMDPELDIQVLGPLFRYLIRYIAAFAHRSPVSNNAPSSETSHCSGSSSTHLSDEEMVLAVYQLLCYHISTATNSSALLTPCISELPLALVNIGCDPQCFPPVTLEPWNISPILYHSKSPNSAADSIAQMHAMQLLLNVLSNCLARAAERFTGSQTQQMSSPLSDASLDDLVCWLLLLGQDPVVLACSLHISVSTAVTHALHLYSHFASKVQDLVERISSPWLNFGPTDDTDPSDGPSSATPAGAAASFPTLPRLDAFPHHTVSYVCCTLLADSDRARTLASSLAFVSLSVCLECQDYEVLDYVEMSDMVSLLFQRRQFLLQHFSDSGKLRSFLLLLDCCVTQASIRQPSAENMQRLRTVSDFVRVELVRLLGSGGDETEGSGSSGGGGGAGISSTRIKTQLTGLRTAVLQRWEKIMHLGASVYTPGGQRAAPGIGTDTMDVDG